MDEAGNLPSQPPTGKSGSQSTAVRNAITSIVTDLEARHRTWVRLQPWLDEDSWWPFSEAVTRWTTRIAVVVAVVAVVAVGAWAVVRSLDPIASGDIEAELSEMQPHAALINCSGNDLKDRWTCTVVTLACEPRRSSADRCEREGSAESQLRAEADEAKNAAYVSLIDNRLEQPSSVKTPLPKKRRWLRGLGRPESAVTVVPRR